MTSDEHEHFKQLLSIQLLHFWILQTFRELIRRVSVCVLFPFNFAFDEFKKLFSLCVLQHITSDSYIPCLADLCKALWEVMLSYYRTMEWHEKCDCDESASPSGRQRPLLFETNIEMKHILHVSPSTEEWPVQYSWPMRVAEWLAVCKTAYMV